MRYFTVGYICDCNGYVGDVYQNPTNEFEFLEFETMPSMADILIEIAGERSYRSIELLSITEWSEEDWNKLQE